MAQDSPYIGEAVMTPDGTIVLSLQARSEQGDIGLGQLRYPKGHAQYDDILRHLGGLKVGETKLVKPFPPPA